MSHLAQAMSLSQHTRSLTNEEFTRLAITYRKNMVQALGEYLIKNKAIEQIRNTAIEVANYKKIENENQSSQIKNKTIKKKYPTNIWRKTASFLHAKDYMRMARVCRQFHNACFKNSVLQELDLFDFYIYHRFNHIQQSVQKNAIRLVAKTYHQCLYTQTYENLIHLSLHMQPRQDYETLGNLKFKFDRIKVLDFKGCGDRKNGRYIIQFWMKFSSLEELKLGTALTWFC